MTKLAAMAAIPLFAGYLMAQSDQAPQQQQQQPQQQSGQAAQQTSQTNSTSTTTTTTYSGTLVDAGCYKTNSQKKESNSDAAGSTTTESNSMATNCPATTETTSFGLMTPEGKYVAFDDPGNQRVIEVVKSNKDWSSAFSSRKPVKVHVIGMANGDTLVVKEIK